mmetsp:Transcript_32402/g.74872  ORF Transcript_32402/g.74872 Transcript_32402/m.74872 type:complete len:1525 (+) Transcript_32402:68-4642(+)
MAAPSAFTLAVAFAAMVQVVRASCPAMCSATTDNTAWPCRYYGNGCQVTVTPNPSRANATDLNIAVISAYSGGLGELMTMVEPLLAAAAQEVEDSNLLPGFRMNVYIGDSQCTSSRAIGETLQMFRSTPTKHVLMGDSCSESCEAMSDAARYFNVLQVSPGCVSTSLSDSTRFPYFTRLAPSYRFNVQTLYEFFVLLGIKRVGIVYGFESINRQGKDLFLEHVRSDMTSGLYNWTILFTHIISKGSIADAENAVKAMEHKDSRINLMMLYQAEGAMLLCQSYRSGYYSPDYNFMVASGWWNPSFINERAGQSDCPCTVSELHRASYGLLAADRGPMLQTSALHGLSGRQLSQIYADYTQDCQSFGGGAGMCKHQWAGYYYDSFWLIASALHSYLIDGSRSETDLGTEASRTALENLVMQADFQGSTGRVRLFNSVEPTTTPPSLGDREGVVVLRQAGGPAASTFTTVASRTDLGMVFEADIAWSPNAAHRTSCLSGTCDLASFIPADRAVTCAGGTAWTNDEGCVQCPIGEFASGSMTRCEPCPPGSISSAPGTTTCGLCPPGTFTKRSGSTFCEDCSRGLFEEESGSSECTNCPVGTYADREGQRTCTDCPSELTTLFEAAMDSVMCICSSGISWQGQCITCRAGTRFEDGECVRCPREVICEGGEIVRNATTDAEWSQTIDIGGRQRTLSQIMTNGFLLMSLGIEPEVNKEKMRSAMRLFEQTLHDMLVGNASVQVIAAPTEELKETIEKNAMPRTAVLIKLLEDNADNPAQAPEGVLYDLYQENQLLFDVSDQMLSMLMDAAQAAGAVRNTLLASVAGRQRSIIQTILTQVLFVAKNVAVASSVQKLMYNVELFETSHNAILRGADWAGIPQLTQMCTVHQMRDVSFGYEETRGLARQVFNAQSNTEAVTTANRVAKNMSSLSDPLADAMNEAAAQFLEGPSDCRPVDTITDSEWTKLIAGLADQRIRSQQIARLYLQVANNVLVEQSKVELAVEVSSTSEALRGLQEGDRAIGMPAPPTQETVNGFVAVGEQWAMMAPVFNDAISQEVIPEENVQRIANLLQTYQTEIDLLMWDVGQASLASGSHQPLVLLDASSEQRVRIQKLPQEAALIHFGYQVAQTSQRMNLTASEFHETHQELLLGSSRTAELVRVANVCVVAGMRKVSTDFVHLEKEARHVAAGQTEAFPELARLTDLVSMHMSEASDLLARYYDGLNLTCQPVELPVEEWQEMMREAFRLCSLSQKAVGDFVLAGQGELLEDALDIAVGLVNSSLKDLMLGRAEPFLPSQPNQALYDRVLGLEALLGDFVQAIGGDRVAPMTAAAETLCVSSLALGGKYREAGIVADETWPGMRVEALQSQRVTANKAFNAAVQNAATEMYSRIQEFESRHEQLRTGGDGVGEILPERQDMLSQWDGINAAWSAYRQAMTAGQSATEMTLTLTELEKRIDSAVPVFATPDPVVKEGSPVVFVATYGTMGLILCLSSCLGCYMYYVANHKKKEKAEKEKQEKQEKGEKAAASQA